MTATRRAFLVLGGLASIGPLAGCTAPASPPATSRRRRVPLRGDDRGAPLGELDRPGNDGTVTWGFTVLLE